MGKSGIRIALVSAVAAGGFLLLDLIMDNMIGGTPMFSIPHFLLTVGIMLTSFVTVNWALESRRHAEEELRIAHDQLELRVQQRTAELEQSNANLQAEISERKRAEQERTRSMDEMEKARQRAEELAAELQLTNNMLHVLFDTLPVGMVILDADGEIAMANLLVRTIMGNALTGEAADENGDSVLSRMDGTPIYQADLPMNRALQHGEITTGLEVQLRRPDGSIAYIYIAAGPVRDEAGHITGAVKIVQDISGLKHMERALRESEERYRTQFDFFPEPSMVWDQNGVLIMQNLVSARNLGGQREEFIGKTAQELFGEAAKGYIERMNRVLETGISENQEDVFETPQGVGYFWTTMQRIRNSDNQFTVQIISYDITERKQVEVALRASEEKFATVFHFSPDAIVIVRKSDEIIIDVNQAFTKLLGHSPSEIIGKTWREISPFANSSDEDWMSAQFQENGGLFDYEINTEMRPGVKLTVLLSLIPIQIGGEASVLAITHDITTRKRSEEALLQIQAELAIGIQERSAMQERQRLARELHDSVSQALYGISLGAHTALTLIDSDRAKVIEALNYVLSLAQAGLAEMRALIFELRPESLELEGLVKALSKQTAALRARHGIEVELNLCDEPEVPISIKEAIYRITQEAMQNAMKHARSSQLDVRLFVEVGHLVLEVCDNGIGFDPLAAHPGHLGLHSMRERAANMGGTLEIVSAENCGTQIRAVIPIPVTESA